ncbi:hypothetical protein BHM03_00032738, partial [Ensete ventricosum]
LTKDIKQAKQSKLEPYLRYPFIKKYLERVYRLGFRLLALEAVAGFYVVVEESTRLGLAHVRKLVCIGREEVRRSKGGAPRAPPLSRSAEESCTKTLSRWGRPTVAHGDRADPLPTWRNDSKNPTHDIVRYKHKVSERLETIRGRTTLLERERGAERSESTEPTTWHWRLKTCGFGDAGETMGSFPVPGSKEPRVGLDLFATRLGRLPSNTKHQRTEWS